MPDIQSRRVTVCSIKGLGCPHSLTQGAKPSYSMATLGLELQFGIRVGTKVVSVKMKEPMGQICMVLSLGYVGVREVEQNAF